MQFPMQGLIRLSLLISLLLFSDFSICFGQDYIIGDGAGTVGGGGGGGGAGAGAGEADAKGATPPPEQNNCNGIFLSYTFVSREKVFPRLKNVTAQPWAFRSEAMILNAGLTELKAWKMFIGFQNHEILVSVNGAVVIDGSDFPVMVGNGTTLAGYPMTDLKTSIETAGNMDEIQVNVELVGTMFGIKPPGFPMPKTINLVNDGYKCPAPRRRGKRTMHICCTKDPKFKVKAPEKTKFFPRQDGDLSLTYDVMQAYGNNYLAQVTIDNNNPLGRLDHWNLTWEWMRGEFIHSMRGAYTYTRDISQCIYGPTGQFYQDFDFTGVMSCDKRPVIADLPVERKDDDKIGKLPYCCRNGSLLPTMMDESKARSIFQLHVFKLPPDMNRTALTPPQKWKITGILNPKYVCGPPLRVDPTEFPDPSGLQSTSTAVASWQVVCNITRPKMKQSKCCVSFSAYYNDSVIPCNTCACGCEDIDTDTCNPNAKAMMLPPEALLVPFHNRTAKARAWARIKRYPNPKKLPCPDNCGVSLNWHINSDYAGGWTARLTLFNWEDYPFADWFTAVRLDKAGRGYENVYSFNGTLLPNLKNTIFLQGLPGLTYLMGEVNGTHPEADPRIPGKQQSVISFNKKGIHDFDILLGDGFPNKVIFNGEECSLPSEIPLASSGQRSSHALMPIIFVLAFTFMHITHRLH
ncbi:COBRA-like protein 10 [Cucurbita pepo subsp. pepo]|uniref:COBRA-like protein 10 n=1 Tax=Cucurbita pepo subsp. pepo TaxID=3664 RepID=UPI000C9D70D2|nr:COBRA-like protein 10 [Cucurbita pepo subsp. pepo]